MPKAFDRSSLGKWTQSRFSGETKNGITIIAFATAGLVQLWHFLRLSWFFLHFPPISDSEYYMAVGRSLLNGLSLYRDMFESKPPIIFWLTEVSLGTGHPALYIWIQVALLLSLAPVLAFFMYRTTKSWIATACASLLGITVAFETVVRTVAFQPEGFGLVLAIFSILLFAYTDRRLIFTVLSGITLGTAAMIKEPFVAAALLGMLVFCRTRNDFLRLAVILCIGGIVSILILALSGSIDVYFSIYLPEMFGGRAVSSIMYPDFGNRVYYVIAAPLWVRALNIKTVLIKMAIPVWSALYPGFFLICLGLFAPLAADLRKRSVAFSFVFLMVVIYCSYKAFVLYELVSAIHLVLPDVPWGNPRILETIAKCLVPLVVFAVLWIPKKWRPSWRTIGFSLAMILGLFLTAALVVYGGDAYGQYIGFAMPPFVAVSIYCLSESTKQRNPMILAALSCVLIVNAFMPGKGDTQFQYYSSKSPSAQRWQRAGKSLDALMDSCNVDRYFLAEANPQFIFAFTKHSPYQITYGQSRALGSLGFTAAVEKPNAYFADKFSHDLKETQIVVALPDDDPFAEQEKIRTEKILKMDAQANTPLSKLPEQIIPILQSDFTLNPPKCATDFVPIEGIKVFFRKDFQS